MHAAALVGQPLRGSQPLSSFALDTGEPPHCRTAMRVLSPVKLRLDWVLLARQRLAGIIWPHATTAAGLCRRGGVVRIREWVSPPAE